MTQYWQPSFDPMEELINSRNRIRQLEVNQRELVNVQNELGAAVKDLVLQHNELIIVVKTHKQEIQRLRKELDQLKLDK